MSPSLPPLSRRQVLAGSALTLTLAGLSGRQETTADTPTATVTEQNFPNTVDDPDFRTVRNSESGPAVTSSTHSPQEDFVEEGSDWGDEHWAIGTESERDALQYAQPTTGVEAAQSFVAETDLAAETLVVNQYRADSCRSMELGRLQWVEDGDAPEGYYDVDLAYADSDVEGFHRTTMTVVTQTPDDSIATVCLTPPQPPALLGLRPALLVPRTIGLAALTGFGHARLRAPQ